MPEARDGLGRTLTLDRPAGRVVSLVPSLTEAVASFDRGATLVACTKFCAEPAGLTNGLRKIGGTKDPDVGAITRLDPDLVLANKEENRREDVEALQAAGLTVFVGDAHTVDAALDELEAVATLLGSPTRRAFRELRDEVELQAGLNSQRPAVRVFCPIWRTPLMAVGGDTFAGDMLRLVGARNVFETHPSGARYPQVTLAELEAAAPQVILLPSEPFHFRERHRQEFLALRSLPAVQNDAVLLCDGRDLTWYGPRIADGLRRLEALVDRGRPEWQPPARADEPPPASPVTGLPQATAKPRPPSRPPARRRPAGPAADLPPGLRLDASQQDIVDEGTP